jgi:hypothetical protein
MTFCNDFRVTAFAFDTRGRVWACKNLNDETGRSDL